MKELTLQETKEIELGLLKQFHSFCVENNIHYFISHGTLLGAIRYKGFVVSVEHSYNANRQQHAQAYLQEFPEQSSMPWAVSS